MTYCYRCDQCGLLADDDKQHAYWHLDHRLYDAVAEHYARPTDVDFCSLACLSQWAAAQEA